MNFEKVLQKRGVIELKKQIDDNYGGVIDSNEAVSILYQLCKLLTKNDKNFEPNSMFDLIVLCSNNVCNLKEHEIEPFLVSIYHFMKYFLKHKIFENVVTLCYSLTKNCLNNNIKSDMYGYYVQFLTREIFAHSKNYDGHILQETILFSIKCETLLYKSDIKTFYSRLTTYPMLFKHSHINNAQRNNFCLNFMKVLSSTELKDEYVIHVYKSFLNVCNLTVSGVSQCQNVFPKYIQKTLEEIIIMMKKIFKTQKYNDCIEILNLLFRAIIQDVKNFNKKNVKKLKQCYDQVEELFKNNGIDHIFGATCSQIGKILKITLDYFGKSMQNWNDDFPVLEIYRMFELIETIVSKNSFDVEKCCTKCDINIDIHNAISSCAICVEILNTIVRQRVDQGYSQEIHETTIRIITECCRNIQILQKNGCDKYPVFWKYLGLHTYNIAVSLYKVKNYVNSKLYSDIFLRNLMLMEGNKKTSICFKDAFGAALHLHSTNCQNLNEKKEAMLYLVLAMLASKEYRKKAMWTWVLIKSDEQSDDEIRTITVNDVLFSKQEDLRKIMPNFTYDLKSAEELMMYELHYYYENWSSRIPIISCCNELIKLTNNIFIKTKALLLSYDKFLIMFDLQIISSVESTIDMIKNSPNNFSYNMCLSLLKFMLYQFKFYELILKNIDDMNKVYIPLKSAVLEPYEEPPNPNDKCDIVPAFLSLKLDCLIKLYEYLDESVSLWSLILDKELTDAELLFLKDYKMLKIIKLTAFEYRLHHFHVQMINTWILYYKLAEILNDDLGILEGIGFILEYADFSFKEIINLENIAEEIIKSLDSTVQEHLYCLTTFYVNRSSGKFKNGLVNQAYEDLCKAEKYFLLCTCDNICKARILHLKTQFLLIPCTYEIINHQENVLVTAQAAYTYIAEIYKINALKCAYTTSVLFEISLSNGWIYKHLRLPREVRCYSKESVILAQKCLLPIRTAQFLSLLAFTDLLDRQYMDCQVKLSGLIKILCSSNNLDLVKPIIKVTSCEEVSKSEMNCDTDNHTYFQTVLHVPTPEPQRITSSELGSPNLRKKTFVLPDFIFHNCNCDCYICRNYEYQKLVFDTIHLEALLNLYQGERDLSNNFFDGGMLLLKKLRFKIQNSNPIKLLNTEEFSFTRLCRNISINFSVFLLDYSYFLMQNKDFQKAGEILDNISLNNDDLRYTNISFCNEVILQKTNLLILNEKIIVEYEHENVEPELLFVANTIVSTTPENKNAIIKPITVCKSPGIKSKFPKHVKKIQFDLSSDSESDRENLVHVGKQKTPKIDHFKLKTPRKTPAPKIKIYTPKTVKQPKRTVSTVQVTSTPNQTQTKFVNNTLEKRTKLLTEKLKASQKVPQVGSTNKNVDKNAVDDLNMVTETIEKLTLNSKEPAKKKYTRIIQPNFSSSLSSLDSPNNAKNKKVLGSRIKKVNASTKSGATEGTRKSSRNRK